MAKTLAQHKESAKAEMIQVNEVIVELENLIRTQTEEFFKSPNNTHSKLHKQISENQADLRDWRTIYRHYECIATI